MLMEVDSKENIKTTTAMDKVNRKEVRRQILKLKYIFFYLFLKASSSMLMEANMRENIRMTNVMDMVRKRRKIRKREGVFGR